MRWHDAAPMAQAGLTPEEARPNALLLCYPVVTAGEFAHRGSFVDLTGTEEVAARQPHLLEALVSLP